MSHQKIFLNAGMVAEVATGVGVYSQQLLKRLLPVLEEKNIRYTLYAYDISVFSPYSDKCRKISLGKIGDKIFKKRITIHRHIWNILYLPFIAWKYDLLFSTSSHGTIFHKNQIITIHDLICFAYPQQYKGQFIYFKTFVSLLIRKSKHIVAISNFTKTEVVKYYGIDEEKVSTIYNGVNHFEDSAVSEQDIGWVYSVTGKSPFCIVVGASYEHKNVKIILEAFAKLRNPVIKVVIVSKADPHFLELQLLAKSMKLDNVIFLSFISRNKLAALYTLANLNLYLSGYEGFGFPPAEAMYFGTPSLLSYQPALIEIYGNFSAFVDPVDAGELAEKISEMFYKKDSVDPSLYDRLKQNYNWERAAQQTASLIKRYL